MNRCINVDWLAIHAKGVLNRLGTKWFGMHQREYGSKFFAECWDQIDHEDNDKIATIQAVPYSPIIPKETVIIQYMNRYLYRKDIMSKITSSMFDAHLVPVGYSRIDIACDFNRFDNNLNPVNLIKGFMDNKYLKRGVTSYTLIGDQKLNGHNYEYIRFGKRNSGVCVYLYNKSLELDQVKNKEYIRQAWAEAGLRLDVPVWRLEFSIDPSLMRFKVRKTDQDLDLLKFEDMRPAIWENIVDCLVEKYFDFRINDGSRRSDRMKRVSLFPANCKTTLQVSRKENMADCGRMDKVLLKRLLDPKGAYRIDDQDINDIAALDAAAEVIIRRKGLEDYATRIHNSAYKS